MSIINISITMKQTVLLRLLENGENIKDACSKAGLCVKIAEKYLINKSEI